MYALSQTPDQLSAALAVLPSCYSQQLENCLNAHNANGLPVSQCAAINSGYDADWDAMKAKVDALPYCPGPKQAGAGALLLAATGGVVVGVLLDRLLLR